MLFSFKYSNTFTILLLHGFLLFFGLFICYYYSYHFYVYYYFKKNFTCFFFSLGFTFSGFPVHLVFFFLLSFRILGWPPPLSTSDLVVLFLLISFRVVHLPPFLGEGGIPFLVGAPLGPNFSDPGCMAKGNWHSLHWISRPCSLKDWDEVQQRGIFLDWRIITMTCPAPSPWVLVGVGAPGPSSGFFSVAGPQNLQLVARGSLPPSLLLAS